MGLPRVAIHILAGIGLVCSLMSGVQAQDFCPWRPLTEEEEQARTENVPAEDADPSVIEGDFDGDGTQDKALIAIRKADGVRDLIVLIRTNRIYPVMVGTVDPRDGMRLAEPGPWDTICGNAFREFHEKMCASGYPKQIKLKNPGILVVSNGQTSLFFWNSKKRLFDAYILVD